MWTFSPQPSFIYFSSQGFQALPQIPLLPSEWCSPSTNLFFCLTRPVPQASSVTAFPLAQASAASVESGTWLRVREQRQGKTGFFPTGGKCKSIPPNVDFFRKSPSLVYFIFHKKICIYFIFMTWTWFSWLGFHEKEHALNWKCST